MATARYYDPDQNPNGAHIPGVPLRDLSDDEFAALADWDKASVDAAPFYRRTNPSPTPRKPRAVKQDTPAEDAAPADAAPEQET